MNNNKKILGKIIYVITLLFLLVILYFAYEYYQSNNFNDFIRSEKNLYTSKFKRDKETKYSQKSSYKISSDEFNDAMFYKEVQVEKNQPYKITCMVKTENVIPQEQQAGIGAQISIEGSTERSIAIQGTNEWQKIELIFNSKNRDSINIGFRLGGNLGLAKGKAWFSDFKLEEGTTNSNNEWKFACFILKTTDVNLNGKEIKLQINNSDENDIKNTINRFETSCYTLSKNKMNAKCDIYEINTPLNELSYDEQFGYYVAPENVETQIKDTITNSDYDHIFVIVKLRR